MDLITRFYLKHLGGTAHENLVVDCPFCQEHGVQPGKLVVYLNRESFFHGYFRCQNRCVPGGFPVWFARLAAISAEDVPGYDPEHEIVTTPIEYPSANLDHELDSWQEMFADDILESFKKHGVGRSVLRELKVGFNGRYISYPYIQEDSHFYSARCVHPEQPSDFFWHGDEAFSREPFYIFNLAEIRHCDYGTLFLCEGERNLLPLRQLGFPGIAVANHSMLEKLDSRLFDRLHTIFVATANTFESENSARSFASRIGYKTRLITWPEQTPRGCDIWQLAEMTGRNFGMRIGEMIRQAKAFSPFVDPQYEYSRFVQTLESERGEQYQALSSGFPIFDGALGGVHGINVIGGGPKVGKSTFLIQIASEMARRGIPVLYYDFENGRQHIYQRTICRLARVPASTFRQDTMDASEQVRYAEACSALETMMRNWRVINDRAINPELMRKHIEFIRHETKSDYTVVVIDSLHKLPFKDFSERRTGIDAWLRQMESIRDELQVSFLVISELSREGTGSYREEPHMGVFKGSGDIEYSADNAMVLFPDWRHQDQNISGESSVSKLWLVASREHAPGCVAEYHLDYPFWGFVEKPLSSN
jgi:KaiC/GvpD/RAD55 family RecA-like ATPase